MHAKLGARADQTVRNKLYFLKHQHLWGLREDAPENQPYMNHMLRWGWPICAKLGPGIDFGPKICLATFFLKNFGGKFEFRAIFH